MHSSWQQNTGLAANKQAAAAAAAAAATHALRCHARAYLLHVDGMSRPT